MARKPQYSPKKIPQHIPATTPIRIRVERLKRSFIFGALSLSVLPSAVFIPLPLFWFYAACCRATATEAPTTGLLPIPIKPIIFKWIGTGKLSITVHPDHGVGHAVGRRTSHHIVREQGSAGTAARGHGRGMDHTGTTDGFDQNLFDDSLFDI